MPQETTGKKTPGEHRNGVFVFFAVGYHYQWRIASQNSFVSVTVVIQSVITAGRKTHNRTVAAESECIFSRKSST